MREYLSFDPGKTTGYVHALVSDYRNFELLKVGDIAWGSCLPFLNSLIASSDPQVLIVEDFRMYAHAAEHLINNDFPAVRVIGRIEAFAFGRNTSMKIVLQMPAVRSSVKILDEHVEALKGTHHAKDAYRHLRYYLVYNRIFHSL